MAATKKKATQKTGKSSTGKKASTNRNLHEKEMKSYGGAITAVILFASALMFSLSIFGVHALLLDGYAQFAKGLLGVGFFAMPVSFIAVVWLLIVTSDSRKSIGQIIAFFCLPVEIGAWGHLFMCWGESYFSIGVGKLYTDGAALKCGGMVSGLFTDALNYLLSPFGTIVLLIVAAFMTSLYIVRLRLRDIWSQVFQDIRLKNEVSGEASDRRREERKARREEERKLYRERWEEEKANAIRQNTIQENDTCRQIASPEDYDLPLAEERPKPKGIFKLHKEKVEDQEEERVTEEDLSDVDIEMPEVAIDRETGEVHFKEESREEQKTIQYAEEKGKDWHMRNDVSDIMDGLTLEEINQSESGKTEPDEFEETEEIAESEKIEEETDSDIEQDEDPISDDMIRTPDGKQDIMLEEAGIRREDIEQDEAKLSSGLRPSDAEKRRLEETRSKNQLPPYQKPDINLLKQDNTPPSPASEEEVKQNAKRLIETLQSFSIDARIANIIRGPSITRYEVQLKQGIRFSKLTSLSDDIALALAAQSVRIAAIPDKVSIGIEVPNKVVSTVYIRDCIDSAEFAQNPSKVAFALGKDITGKVIAWDIAKLPHMLVAGTTGSGKSVCINSLLVSLLYKADPNEVKFIMIDPKIIELGVYNGIPHLMTPVVTDPKKAAGALQWAVYEMMRRYKQMADFGVRSVFEYNAEVERRWKMPKEEGDEDRKKLPQIVIVIDELADLMLSSPREVEEAICRIAQMARAAGMHLIIATQRPSADVITGLMKANIPSRIAFAVSGAMESRIILDTQGAEKLIGKGDMLFSPIGAAKPIRIQGCFISSSEIEAVCEHAKRSGAPEYDQSVLEHIEKASQDIGKSGKKASVNDDNQEESGNESPDDPLLFEAIDVVMESQMASASGLQRRLKLGYTRAARLIDIMEEKGIVGPFQGSKPREILMSKDRWMEMKASRGE